MIVATVGIASPEATGDWWYRTAQPLHALSRCDGIWAVEVTQIHRARQQVIDRADVLVLNMVWDPALEAAITARRARGQVTVLEFNDDLGEAPGATVEEKRRHAHLLMTMPLYDGVQFSSPVLARRYSRWCRRHVVVPNQMAHSMVAPPERVAHFVVGWGGSFRHRADLEAVMPALNRWLDSRKHAYLLVMADPAVFAGIARHDKATLVPPGPIDAYYRFIATLDVGIAPLNLTQYNRCRSDVKWLEYAAHGVVPVVQDLDPYQQADPCLRFTSPQELCDHLTWLHDHPEERARLATRAQQAARARDHHLGALQRLQFYRDLQPPDTQGHHLVSMLQRYDGASVEERYVNCWFGEHERAEYSRLVHT